MAEAGPYGITQFDAPGIIGAYQTAQHNRIAMMYEQKQLEKMDADAKRTANLAAAWSKVVGPSSASSAVDAYGKTPEATPAPATAPSAPADPLAPLPDAQAAPAPTAAPAAAPAGPMGQINQAAVPELLSALGPEAGTQFLEHWQTLQKNQQEAVAAHMKDIGQAMAWADTPEKWNQAIDVLSKQSPQLAKYKGHFDQRGQAALQVGAISSFVEASKPKLMAVADGSHVIDENHPESGPVYTAPDKPTEYHQFSVHNADGTDTPYGFDPKTGKTFQLTAGSGPAAGGAATEGPINPDTLFNGLIYQESHGHPGVIGPPTKYGRSTGLTQLLPDTAKAMAEKLGVPWQPELLTEKTPEAAAYQYKLGRAYFDEGMQKYPNDPRDALMYYHGGPDMAQWGPKTHAYADAILKRVGGSSGVGPASEGGTPITGKGGGGLLSDDAAKLAAAIYKTKGSMPSQIGRTKGDVDKIMNIAAHMTIEEAHQVADQTVGTWQNTKSAEATLTAFSKGKQGDTTRSLNVAIQHIDLLRSAALALQNGNIPMFNSVAQHIAQATGHVAPTNFDGLKQLVSDEVVKGVVGTAAGVTDRSDAGRTVGRASSPQQLVGIFDNWQNLMAGQAQGLQKQYEAGTGRKDYADKYLLPRTRQLLLKQEGVGQGWITTKSGLRIRKVN